MIDILLFAIIIGLGSMMRRVIVNHGNKNKQHTFIYCRKCNNELVKNGQFIEDNDGIIKYRCSKCGNISFWDFANFPVPMLRTCGDCAHLIVDEFGYPYCEKENRRKCSPDTQVSFEYKLKDSYNIR